jgi:hypothetical protein
VLLLIPLVLLRCIFSRFILLFIRHQKLIRRQHDNTNTLEIVDCSTGEETIIPLTAEEIAQMEADAAAYAEAQAAREAEAEALAALKASARAKLVAGQPLTEEEAATLVI